MSYKRVETLGDACRHGMLLEIICKGCDRVRRVNPDALMGRGKFGAAATFEAIGARMRCRGKDLEGGGCGHRGAVVRPIFEPSDPGDGGPTGGGNVVLLPVRREAVERPMRVGVRRAG